MHMPKTATAMNKATYWNKGGMLGKKNSIFPKNGSVKRPKTEKCFGAAFSQENGLAGRLETEFFMVVWPRL